MFNSGYFCEFNFLWSPDCALQDSVVTVLCGKNPRDILRVAGMYVTREARNGLAVALWPFPVLLEVVGKSSWYPSCDFWGPLHYCVMCEPLCSASKVFHDCAEGPDFHSLHWWRLCNRNYFGHWFKGAEWYAQSIWQVMGWGALFRGCQLTTSQVSFWGSAV